MSGIVPLSQGVNFRDIGGLPVADGKIRAGTIYRSGRLNRLTQADRDHLETLDIKLICDLRGPAEQEREPYNWLPSGARLLDQGHSSSGDVSQLSSQLNLDSSLADGRRVMVELYRRLAKSHADRYALIFRAVATGDVPAIIACTAGKDRTGMAIAILMTLIGATRSTTIENYSLSQQLYDFEAMFDREAEAAEQAGRTDSNYLNLVRSVSRDALRMICASDPDYVAAGLTAIDEEFGDVIGYARNRLGLTVEEITALRHRLVV